VPPCNAEHHGYELLATIDGTDTKFSCNPAHGLYSWMGAASEGGYLGADAQSFFSAVVSGAAGSYIVTLTEDAGVSTDLMIEPGMDVRISGDSGLAAVPSWGASGFTVRQFGSLSLSGVTLAGALTVQAGGTATISSGSLNGRVTVQSSGVLYLSQVILTGAHGVDAVTGALVTNHDNAAQCEFLAGAYTTVSDVWRGTSAPAEHIPHGAGATHTGDITAVDCGCCGQDSSACQATGVGNGDWYRFVGAGGDALPLSPPGKEHCGTHFSGWLSGWDPTACTTSNDCPVNSYGCSAGTCAPTPEYNVAGHYPAATDGVVEMTACFDSSDQGDPNSQTCYRHATVGVLRCGGFLLWRLPYAASVDFGYCTAPSGLPGSSGRRLLATTNVSSSIV
jgi:hypothetical protein